MNAKVAQLINEQIMKEFFSAYLYLDMANYYSEEGLMGFENWFNVQAQEERDHAMLFRQYMQINGEKVTFFPIEAPQEAYSGFGDPLIKSLGHEKSVTASIHRIYAAAHDAQDYRTMEFLNWFVKEQAEEEKNSGDLIKKYELFGKDSQGLYQLDQELSARAYTPPSLVLD